MASNNADQNQNTNARLGVSQFGNRLKFTTKEYRDSFWAILYYLQLTAIIIVAIYFFYQYVNNDVFHHKSNIDLTGILVTLVICGLIAILMGLIWLQIIKQFALSIIKPMIFLNIILWAFVAVWGALIHSKGLMITGIILSFIALIYPCFIWDRIPFASALLATSSKIVNIYKGTILIAFVVIIFDIILIFIYGILIFSYSSMHSKVSGAAIGLIFLFLVSFFWGIQVNINISHMTTCGVTATWYFTNLNYEPKDVTINSFNRAMTTSFGSICLGSLLVAILQAIRTFINLMRRNEGICDVIIDSLLSCIESIVQYFNSYAFAHCAIYGTSFIESGKATWDLFKSRGILAIINDDLTGMVIVFGSFFSMIMTGLLGYYIGSQFYGNDKGVLILLVITAGAIGYVLCFVILNIIASSIIALFVCFAEDPAALANNHPDEYEMIVRARPDFADNQPVERQPLN